MKLKTPLIVTAAAVGLAFGSYFANGDRYLAYFDSQIKTCWHTAHRTVNESDSLRLIQAGKRLTNHGMRVDLTYNVKDSRGLTRPSYIHCTFSRRALPTFLSDLRVNANQYAADEVRLIRDYGLTILPVVVSNN